MRYKSVELISEFYKQINLFSENGTTEISSPNIMCYEVHKCSEVPRKEVNELFFDFEKIGFLKKSTESEYGYTVSQILTLSQLIDKINKQ